MKKTTKKITVSKKTDKIPVKKAEAKTVTQKKSMVSVSACKTVASETVVSEQKEKTVKNNLKQTKSKVTASESVASSHKPTVSTCQTSNSNAVSEKNFCISPSASPTKTSKPSKMPVTEATSPTKKNKKESSLLSSFSKMSKQNMATSSNSDQPVSDKSDKVVESFAAVPLEVTPVENLYQMSANEIEIYKRKLLVLQARLSGDVSMMTDAALNKNRLEASGDLSAMPIHMADVGTDNFEQEQTLSFMQNENGLLEQVLDALRRIKDGTFGICESCGCRIPKIRLNFLPYASMCVQCTDKSAQDD